MIDIEKVLRIFQSFATVVKIDLPGDILIMFWTKSKQQSEKF